jgi:hypothetical protein
MDDLARERIRETFRTHELIHVIDVMDTMLDWGQPTIRICTIAPTTMTEAGHGESRGFRFYFSKPVLVNELVPDEFVADVYLFVRTAGWEHFANDIEEFSPEELALLDNACRGYGMEPPAKTPQEDVAPHPVDDLFKDLYKLN